MASLVSDTLNEAALDHFIRLPVSRDMISHLAAKASGVLKCEPITAAQPELSQQQQQQQLPPTPPTTPPPAEPTAAAEPPLPTVEAFITAIVERSHVQVPTLMTSLVYLSRLQERLPPVAKGMRCTVHRIFLASLILAAKNLNDSSPKNKHWARYSSATRGFPHFGFSTTEVNLMEKQMLYLLDWDLRITNADLYAHLEPFLAPIRSYHARKAEHAMQAMVRERELREQLHAQQQRDLQHQQLHQLSQAVQAAHAAQAALGRTGRNPRRACTESPRSTSASSAASCPAATTTTTTVSSPSPRRPAAAVRSTSVDGYIRPPRPAYATRSSSRLSTTRTPSLSPPSRSESIASTSYTPSATASPVSSTMGSAYVGAGSDSALQSYQHHGYSYSYAVPDVVHLAASHTPLKHQPLLPLDHSSPIDHADLKPAKKLKLSASNIFTRMFGASSLTSSPAPTATLPAAPAPAPASVDVAMPLAPVAVAV